MSNHTFKCPQAWQLTVLCFAIQTGEVDHEVAQDGEHDEVKRGLLNGVTLKKLDS